VDPDIDSMEWVRGKVLALGLAARVTCIVDAVPCGRIPPGCFDVVLAEGLLNVIGFESGLREARRSLRPGGALVIHDELPGAEQKRELLRAHGFRLIGTFTLDEKDWWDGYYRCLEESIRTWRQLGATGGEGLFASEEAELAQYARDPGRFRSIYYVAALDGEGAQ
jgi:SAM-dependent methyltransferase